VWDLSSGHLQVHQLPRMKGAEPWTQSLRIQNPGSQFDLLALTLEKVVCAMASVFVASVGSTFSSDIRRMRFGLGASSCHDQILCGGEGTWGHRREKQRLDQCKYEIDSLK